MRAAALAVLVACSSSKQAPPPPGVALVIAFDGQEIWVGNDDYETAADMKYAGALHDLETTIDQLKLPANSRAGLVVYSTGTEILQSMKPAGELHGALLGDQQRYRGRIGDQLELGVDAALDLVKRAPPAMKRVVIVLGDGHCDDDAKCKPALADAAQRAAELHVELHAIVVRTAVSPPGEIASTFAPHAVTIASPRELPAAIAAALTGT
jgi:hypothetical protein